MLLELVDATARIGSGSGATTPIRRLNLVLQPGEVVAISGPSGSGKTTLLRVLAGELELADGKLLLGGADLPSYDVGFLRQDFSLLPYLTALENVALALELRGVTSREADERASVCLADFDIADLAHRLPSDMSGGQAQRVAAARALVTDPRLLLADEPTAALDSETAQVAMRLLTAHVKRQRLSTLVLTTHDSAILKFADRHLVLRGGRLDIHA